MKRTATDNPKFASLMRRLGLERWAAIGVLEALWQFTAKNARDGAIGRWTDEEIAEGIGWTSRPPSELVEALVGARWVDRHRVARLVIHGWSEHSDAATHMSLARSRSYFVDGERPQITRLPSVERKDAESWFNSNPFRAHAKRTASARRVHGVATASARRAGPPEPRQSPASPPPEPSLVASGEAAGGAPPVDSGESRRENRGGTNGHGKPASSLAPTSATWEAYATAYEARYHAPPIRNRKVNAQLRSFLERVPAAEAPSIAAYYVAHGEGFCRTRGHPVACLLQDAEKFRTEWLTREQQRGAGRTPFVGQ